ncbi:FtsX-like permease family protein [Lacticaseibacillus porcinae]|uniref:FtsX-like permease family protein n=1 Tax=Lacticaseibacillus porcinae TaxID=1123687 RepID=UPI000F780BEA|nr:FtsX-like permease family protein [Lacticaseibacillus porcinae]
MRFLERAIKALGYHRRPYLAGLLVSGLFTIISMVLLTATQLNLATQTGFKNRLQQFDTSAIKSADDLIKSVQTAYAGVNVQYGNWWWASIIALAVITFGFAIYLAKQRQQETNAYLLVGKSAPDIISQYLLEGLVVFVVGFGFAWIVLMCFTQVLDQVLVKLNATLLDQQLSGQVSATSFAKLTKKLFAHRITDFSQDSLVIPHRGIGPRPETSVLTGLSTTFLSGICALVIPQTLVYAISIWRARRRLRHH